MHGHFFCIAERGGKLDGPTPPVRWAWWFIGWEVGSDSTQLRVGACPSMASTVSGAARTGWGERGVPRHSTPSAAPQHAHGHLHPMPTWTPAPRADTDSCTPCRYGHLRHHIHTPPPPPFPAGTAASANTSHTDAYVQLRCGHGGPAHGRNGMQRMASTMHSTSVATTASQRLQLRFTCGGQTEGGSSWESGRLTWLRTPSRLSIGETSRHVLSDGVSCE